MYNSLYIYKETNYVIRYTNTKESNCIQNQLYNLSMYKTRNRERQKKIGWGNICIV